MKGIILVGGTGTRLSPLTDVVNKHLLPIGNKPMVHHAIQKLVDANITDILLITGTEHAGGIFQSLGSGKNFGCKFTYKVQDEANGIAGALLLAEEFVGKDTCCVILGDNIFDFSIINHAYSFEKRLAVNSIYLILKEVEDPERFGVAEVNGNRVISIEEKPKKPKSNYAVTGIYFYTPFIFSVIKQHCKLSNRKEYEISDAHDFYIKHWNVSFSVEYGFWSDAGTMESYKKVNEYFYNKNMIHITPVASSFIRQIEYEDVTQQMKVHFNSGSVYSYNKIPKQLYENFINSPSKGSFFTQNIKGKYE